MNAVLIGGVSSGAGKTTIACGLMGALSRRGLRVQPFKTGPDYIDTTYHTLVTGNPSRNLDTWMLSHSSVNELFARAMRSKDLGVIEGVMGLFDGHSATSDEGSTAELAKLLRVPVILVIEARNAARSVAAVVKGYQSFDPQVTIGGVVLNGVGGESHFRICRQAIESYTTVPVLGYLPRRDDLVLPERHLGLVPTVEGSTSLRFWETLISQCESTLDIESIISLASSASPPDAAPSLFPGQNTNHVTNIGVAMDKAFSFYYQDSLDLLDAWGAEIVPFSPLVDPTVPEGLGGVYFGGGFPELYARELSENASMRRSVKSVVERGMPVYGECGGLMYLGRSIRAPDGASYPMVGAVPVESGMRSPRLTLGYRTVTALNDGPLMSAGEVARGHEFHWSGIERSDTECGAYLVEEGRRTEGFRIGSLLASYIHLHMATLPSMARRFVGFCRSFSEKGRDG